MIIRKKSVSTSWYDKLKKNLNLYECLIAKTAFNKLVFRDATIVVGIQSVKDLSDESILR